MTSIRPTGKPRLYGGYYSQDTVRQPVDYAAKRGVTIVAEIRNAGHATAGSSPIPIFASTDTPPTAVPSDWGVYPNLYNVDERTLRFLEDVLDEVMELSPRVHPVGGDEAVKTQWRASPRIQARMRELGVTARCPAKFVVHRMERYLSAHGRRLIGWMKSSTGACANATVMSWRGGKAPVRRHARGTMRCCPPSPTLLDRADHAAADPHVGELKRRGDSTASCPRVPPSRRLPPRARTSPCNWRNAPVRGFHPADEPPPMLRSGNAHAMHDETLQGILAGTPSSRNARLDSWRRLPLRLDGLVAATWCTRRGKSSITSSSTSSRKRKVRSSTL